MKFKPVRMLKKALVAAGVVAAALTAGAEALPNLTPGQQVPIIVAASALAAAIRAGANYAKQNKP